MKHEFACPEGHVLYVELPAGRDSTAMKVRCPKCNVVFVLPARVVSLKSALGTVGSLPQEITPVQQPAEGTVSFNRTTPPLVPDTVPPNDTAGETPLAATSGKAAIVRPEVPGYAIEAELGRGGMGVVYRARHLKLNRTVALKMILAGGHAGAAELARFRTEAEAIARLQHPHIVQIYEVGESGGHPYCALEFVDGGSLADKLAQGPLALKECARLVEALSRAMQLAHSRNVVHRDLKPANILMSADGTPKVTDFGLARHLDSDSGQTHAGAVMGTPSYMAPEQASGRTHEAGPAADVYALGAILYACLTGKPPFKGSTVGHTLDLVRTQEPVHPSQLRKVPPDLETICLKCLRKEPEKRYASAEALAEDLRRYQANEPVLARPVGRLERTTKWMARHKGLSVGLAAAVVALVTGTVVASWQAIEARIAADNEAMQRQAAEDEKKIAQKEKAAADLARSTADEERKSAERARDDAKRAEKKTAKQLLRAESLIYGMQIQEAHSHLLNHDLVRCREVLDETRWDLRGPDYGYIAKQVQKEAHTLLGHVDYVGCLALSGDGKRLFSGSEDKTIKVWDLESGKETHTLIGHKDGVTSVSLSGDGKRLFSGSMDQTIKVWDLESGKETLSLRGHNAAVFNLAASGDGKRLYSGNGDGTIKGWDLESGKETISLSGHSETVRSLALSRDSKRLFSGSGDSGKLGEIKVWDLESGKETLCLRGHTRGVTSLALSGDGKRLFSGSYRGTIKVWDLSGK